MSVFIRFEKSEACAESCPDEGLEMEFGPYEWVQATHGVIHCSPDGDTLATLDGCWITEAGEDFSDFVVFHRENDLTESPARPGTEVSKYLDTPSKRREASARVRAWH